METRKPRSGEVRSIESVDGRTVIAIIQRPDGLFECYQDLLLTDDEEDVTYWIACVGPLQGLFASADGAEAEMRARDPHLFSAPS